MSLGVIDLLKRLAELGYFHSTKIDPELFRSLVADQLHMEPHQALQMLLNAGYVEMDHGPNAHPISHPDRWRLTLTNRGLTALLEA